MTIDGGSAPLDAVSVDGIDRGMRDGAAVHAAALAAVTYSQDLRMRRGLLGHEGILQPARSDILRGAGQSRSQKIRAKNRIPNGDQTGPG